MGCGDLVCEKCGNIRDARHHYLYCNNKEKIMLNQNVFSYFNEHVIEKLYPQWEYCVSQSQFEDDCRLGHWVLYWTSLSYNPIVPISPTLSYFGEPIDKDTQYMYEMYELVCRGNYEKIGCTVYYKQNDPISFGEKPEAVAVAFYDC
jgi:hypothetical protein